MNNCQINSTMWTIRTKQIKLNCLQYDFWLLEAIPDAERKHLLA